MRTEDKKVIDRKLRREEERRTKVDTDDPYLIHKEIKIKLGEMEQAADSISQRSSTSSFLSTFKELL